MYQAFKTSQAGLPDNGVLLRTNILLPYVLIGGPICTCASYMVKPYTRKKRLTETKEKNFNYR